VAVNDALPLEAVNPTSRSTFRLQSQSP